MFDICPRSASRYLQT